MKTLNGYKMSLVGQRNGITIEEVFDFLKNNSGYFIELERETNDIGNICNWVKITGEGVIEGISYSYMIFLASLGLPGLEINTLTKKDDNKMRHIIHTTGWKGN